MINMDELKFDDRGLIPAVVVDAENGKVLMMAYMNRESLQVSMEKGLACFWSRSRQELWLKGETSGNYQHIVSITADCDRDTLLVKVEKDGPACHTGTETCFNDLVWVQIVLQQLVGSGDGDGAQLVETQHSKPELVVTLENQHDLIALLDAKRLEVVSTLCRCFLDVVEGMKSS